MLKKVQISNIILLLCVLVKDLDFKVVIFKHCIPVYFLLLNLHQPYVTKSLSVLLLDNCMVELSNIISKFKMYCRKWCVCIICSISVIVLFPFTEFQNDHLWLLYFTMPSTTVGLLYCILKLLNFSLVA